MGSNKAVDYAFENVLVSGQSYKWLQNLGGSLNFDQNI